MRKNCSGNSKAFSEVSKYSWGVDGYGRAHICANDDNIVLLCMLSGSCGQLGVWMLEEQDNEQNTNSKKAWHN